MGGYDDDYYGREYNDHALYIHDKLNESAAQKFQAFEVSSDGFIGNEQGRVFDIECGQKCTGANIISYPKKTEDTWN